jgi:2-amino-4-hydroxy-6-hydroxymethyldihydropteridine diphosphokinase
MPRVFVSIGSNIDREKNVLTAVHALAADYHPLKLSSVYESTPFGFHGENFFNLVAGFDSAQGVEQISARLASIEQACGRIRDGKHHDSRTLDMDLLLYGDLKRHDQQIDVPRPEIAHHAFVLLPLAEIAPDLIHPESGLSIKEMWRRFADQSQKLWAVAFDFGL